MRPSFLFSLPPRERGKSHFAFVWVVKNFDFFNDRRRFVLLSLTFSVFCNIPTTTTTTEQQQQALERYEIEKDIAAYIKKEFDKKYQPTWHCVVGRNFGSYVTHETGHFIYFYIGHIAILLFRSG